MMFRLLRAEIRKILGNRWLAGVLVWLWPVCGIVLPLLLLIFGLLTRSSTGSGANLTFQWTDTALGAWFLPTNIFGRLLLVSLAAAIFAGEYQWNTWKNIVPRADRTRVILAKYLAFIVLIVFAFGAMSILMTVGIGGAQAARGLPYPPAPTPNILRTFIRDYLLQIVLTVANISITVAFAALAAMITRSILGSILGGMFFIFGEIGFIAGTTALGIFLHSPNIAALGRLTSALNIANINAWVQTGQPVLVLVEGAGSTSLAGSFAILLVWLVGLVSINLIVFQRQDLT